MENHSVHKKDQRISAIITLIVSLFLLLCIYFYRFTRITPKSEEVVTTMLINFGDNNNGSGEEEPAPEDGSLASKSTELQTTPVVKENQKETSSKPEPKIITGNNTKSKAVKKNKTTKKKDTKSTKNTSTKNKKSTAKKSNSNTNGDGDGKGNAAIGNLLKGRGSRKGSQGTDGVSGNAGDPLGGDGNGNSKIGVDRKLIAFIPGTMGRGGSQPEHNCSASGEIRIAYTVDKSGKVVSANRVSGISDPCVVQTTIKWVKKYVRAERANSSSKGTYIIQF